MPKTEYFITKEVYLTELYPAFLLVLCTCMSPTGLVIHAKRVTGQKIPHWYMAYWRMCFQNPLWGLERLSSSADKALAAKVPT